MKVEALGLSVGPDFELLPSVADLPIETAVGTVYWDGTDYVAVIPGYRLGLYWLRIPLDGGRPLVHLPEDGGHPSGIVEGVQGSHPVDGGAIILRVESLTLLDSQGNRRDRVALPLEQGASRDLLSDGQPLVATIHRDGGSSLRSIQLVDGGLSVGSPVSLASVGPIVRVSVSGNTVAAISERLGVASISTFDRTSGAHLATLPMTQVQDLLLAPIPTGFMVLWISGGVISAQRFDRDLTPLDPPRPFGSPAYSLIRTTRLSDGGVLLAWRSSNTTLIAGQAGSVTTLPVAHVRNLSCEGPVCLAEAGGTAYAFSPGGAGAQEHHLVHVRPTQHPTPFSWNGQLWVVIVEDSLLSPVVRRRLAKFDPDAGRAVEVGPPLPAQNMQYVVAGLARGPAMITDGLSIQLLTDSDGGVAVGPLAGLATGATPGVGVAPRLVGHDDGFFLIMWGASSGSFTVLNSSGQVIVPAQSVPRAVTQDRIAVGTPPGEYWLTFREALVGSPLELVRISLLDGGVSFGTPPGMAVATSPTGMLFETSQGFVLRDHDGGLSSPFGPLRLGPTVWTGDEFHVFPGPARIVDASVLDTALVPWGFQGAVSADGRGTSLQTWRSFEWDWIYGYEIPRARAVAIHSRALSLGRRCQLASDCESGHCVDSVCCDTACGSGALDCQACSVAAGAAVDGTCGPASSLVVCRWDSEACDAREYCDGVTTTCPADRVHDAGFVCRPAQAECDAPERCDGVTPSCPSDQAMPAGTPCDDANECTVNEECEGLYFGRGTCRGTPRTGTCDAGTRCTVGDQCLGGFCVEGPVCPAPECQVAVGCGPTGCIFAQAANGQSCDGGVCANGNCLVSSDAGRADAGSSDAGSSDAGSSDAGSSDAGSSDAGSSDAGSSDAGSSDAGNSDAGNSDAGSSDAGNSDAGNSDAGNNPDGGDNPDGGEPDAGAPPVDAGASDGGDMDSDGGTLDAGDGSTLPSVSSDAGPAAPSGCTSVGGSFVGLLLALRRSRRRTLK